MAVSAVRCAPIQDQHLMGAAAVAAAAAAAPAAAAGPAC